MYHRYLQFFTLELLLRCLHFFCYTGRRSSQLVISDQLPRYGLSALVNNQSKHKPKFQKAFRPTSALAKTVKFRDELMEVHLTDGRIISVPIIWFPLLHEATPEQREHYEIGGGGVSLHWEAIDEDISVAGLLASGDLQTS